MIEPTDGMLLYHGSYTTVRDIDLSRCNEGLENQFCFRTAEAIGTLEFIRGERYGDIAGRAEH